MADKALGFMRARIPLIHPHHCVDEVGVGDDVRSGLSNTRQSGHANRPSPASTMGRESQCFDRKPGEQDTPVLLLGEIGLPFCGIPKHRGLAEMPQITIPDRLTAVVNRIDLRFPTRYGYVFAPKV